MNGPSEFAFRNGQMPPELAGIPMQHVDPNQPTKREVFRLSALQHVCNLAGAGRIDFRTQDIGTEIVKHATAIEKYIVNG